MGGADLIVVDFYGRYGKSAPSSRYRGYLVGETLSGSGVAFRYFPLIRESRYREIMIERRPWSMVRESLLGCLRILGNSAFSPGGIAVVQKGVSPLGVPFLEKWLRRRYRALVLDIDDNVFVVSSRVKAAVNRARSSAAVRYLTKNCDLVICGNAYLAELARNEGRRGPIAVIPTVCPSLPEPERAVQRGVSPPVKVMWVGTEGNVSELDRISEALCPLVAEGAITCTAITDPAARLPVPWKLVPWEAGKELRELARGQIGVMPLAEDEWNKGKCGFKILQYLSAGLAVIAAPIGVNSSILGDGRFGILASSPEEWARSLRALSGDAELRERLATAGNENQRASFSPEAVSHRYRDIFASLARGSVS